nr:hypothetical protein Hi04_10k_c4773_00029 [uncultured bacterium]
MWRRRAFLWKSGLAGMLVALALSFLISNRYDSTTRLMPPDSSSSTGLGMTATLLGSVSPAASGLAGSLLGVKSPGPLLVGVLQSRTVQDDLINRFDLRTVYGSKQYVGARKKLMSSTAISEDSKSGIITITVTDTAPSRARDLAAAYVEELNQLMSQLNTSAARREREFLEERLKKIKQDLDESVLRVSQFSSRNMTFDPQIQGKAMLDATATLQGQLIAAESELSGLEQIYGPENSRVKASTARAGELRSKLRAMSGRISADTRRERGEDGDALRPSDMYPSLEQLPLLGSTYADLARRAKIDEAVYEVLTKQYELAKVQEAKELPTIKVLDAADIPERKSYPPRVLIALLGGFLVFSITASLLLLQHVWSVLEDRSPQKRMIGRVLTTLHMTFLSSAPAQNSVLN